MRVRLGQRQGCKRVQSRPKAVTNLPLCVFRLSGFRPPSLGFNPSSSASSTYVSIGQICPGMTNTSVSNHTAQGMAETPLISETRWKRKPVKRRDSPIANNAFIVTTSLSLAKPDAEARKLIRRHVMLGKNRRASTSPGRQRATPTSWINGGHGSSYHHPQTLRDAADPAEHTFPKINLPRKIGSELALVRFADDMTHNDLELIFKCGYKLCYHHTD